MLESISLVDAHVHAARLPTLKDSWREWAAHYGSPSSSISTTGKGRSSRALRRIHGLRRSGRRHPVCEYSPKSTGIQPVEDLIPLLAYNPDRFRLMANLNPHLHYPLIEELERQISLGAVGLKLHPVHGSFAPNDRMLYPAYAFCEREGFPSSSTAARASSRARRTATPTRPSPRTSPATSPTSP